MHLLSDTLLPTYLASVDSAAIEAAFADLSTPADPAFGYAFEASAVYSSNIEGNTMDLNSFLNAREFQHASRPKEAAEIADLVIAYEFAQRQSTLSEDTFLAAHNIFSEQFVILVNRGVYRKQPIGVFSKDGLVYMAVEAGHVPTEMQKLFEDIDALVQKKAHSPLPITEALFWAAQVHLRLAHIHPFSDGNGRAARLLEKWLLAALLGDKAWALESEKYYKEHRDEYYKNINLGVNYYELNYENAGAFLGMLPQALLNR